METFTALKELVQNPDYRNQKQKITRTLSKAMIDRPIRNLIVGLNALPHCFTLQCCYGHFVYEGQNDRNNLNLLPDRNNIGKIEYRIAYIAFCIQNSRPGRALVQLFKEITKINPQYVQFCCSDWFWTQCLNSYALQVEPDRFKHKDTAIINFKEARLIEKIRNEFFVHLYKVVEKEKAKLF